jgi:hypothetical protein
MNRSAWILVLISLGGCAAQRTAGDIAGASASILNDYRSELGRFANRQNALNADNSRRLRELNELSAERDARVRERVLALKLSGDKSALDLYELLSSPPAPDILADSAVLKGLRPSEAPARIEADTGKTEAIVKQLKALQKTTPLIERILGLAAYRNQLSAAYRKSLSDAETRGEAAKTASDQLTANIAGEGGR